jgi:cyclic nucleotide gated channel beta 1
LTTSLSRKSSVSDQPSISNRFIQKSFRNLIGKFSDRTKRMRNRLEIPPTPPSSGTVSSPQHQKILFESKNDDDEDVVVIETQNEDKSLVGKQTKSLAVEGPAALTDTVTIQHSKCSIFCCCSGSVLDPQGRFYIAWLFIVTLSFLYNAFVIPLRASFPFQTPENQLSWFIADCVADFIYFIDLLFIKHRTMYLYEGFWIRDSQLTRKNYMQKLQFKMDVLSLLPLDLLYLHPALGFGAVYLRVPRFLKIQSFWEFFKLLDRIVASPHFLRVAKTLSYMLYMIHLTACLYYYVSVLKGKICVTALSIFDSTTFILTGLGSNRWVFSGKGNPYVRCFAFATKCATSIGKNPKPYVILCDFCHFP